MIWILLSAFIVWSLVFVLIDSHVEEATEVNSNMLRSMKSLSVVIVMRNEENSILDCLYSLDKQFNLPDKSEVILVDDHSADDSFRIACEYEAVNFDLRVLALTDGDGKKAGLKLALEMTRNELIYFTDADCWLSTHVINELASELELNGCKAVFGPVQMPSNGSLHQRLLQIENLNNQTVTEAFIRLGRPIMANGANMLIPREQISTYLTSLESHTQSGDDVFYAQRIGQSASCIMSNQTTVWTNGPSDFNEFINQRLRWAAKTKNYNSWIAMGFGVLVFCVNLIFFLSLLMIPFVKGVFWILVLFGAKSIIEYTFHKKWLHKYGIEHNLVNAMLLSTSYPLYVVFIGLLSMIGVGYNWKGRRSIR